MKVDIHTHILPESIPDWETEFGYPGFVQYASQDPISRLLMQDGDVFRTVEANCWNLDARRSDMTASEVDVQVLSTVPAMFAYWAKTEDAVQVARYLNDDLADRVSDSPAAFIALGTLPLQAPDRAVAELERCVGELGFAGVQIGTHVNQWNLSDRHLYPVFEAASELGAAVFVHPWEMMGADRMPEYWLPWLVGMPAETSLAICSLIFGGVFERLPDLRVAFAHGGGSFPGTFGRIEHGHRVRPDLVAVDNERSPRDYLGRFWVDSALHDVAALDQVVRLFGSNRVCLGTDYPFPLGESEPGRLISDAGMDAASTQAMLGSNALEWLGRD